MLRRTGNKKYEISGGLRILSRNCKFAIDHDHFFCHPSLRDDRLTIQEIVKSKKWFVTRYGGGIQKSSFYHS